MLLQLGGHNIMYNTYQSQSIWKQFIHKIFYANYKIHHSWQP